MTCSLFACIFAFQQGSPTTPVVSPKPAVVHATGKKVRHKKAVSAPNRISPKPRFVDNPVGSGKPIQDGDVVVIHFLVKKASGESVADSKKRGLPYTFKIGAAGNDPLLDLVVKGMRVGGIRTGRMPAKDAYGPSGALPLIAPADILDFTVSAIRRGDQ